MTFFPPITQDAVVRATLRMQLGEPSPDSGLDPEEALALACKAHVDAIDALDADRDRPEGWPTDECAEEPPRETPSVQAIGWSLDDGGTGHLLSYVHWALWKGGVEEPALGVLMQEMWSGLRPQTVAAANNDLKAHRDHRMPDPERAAEERLLAQLRANHRKIRELTDVKLVGRG